ncbi:MAG TPA: hypothetical protein VHY58_12050 [Streptosporangiaceae bacterium]|nr:hypothetical protein [Streptosporangiaceae bacterium]
MAGGEQGSSPWSPLSASAIGIVPGSATTMPGAKGEGEQIP